MAIAKVRGAVEGSVFGSCGGVANWRWSSRDAVLLHTDRAVGAAVGGDGGIEGVDAGVSLVQGSSRGLGLEFVSPAGSRLVHSFLKRFTQNSFFLF